MIDFSKVLDVSIPTETGEKKVLKIESGGTVLWMHRSISPISLEVEKVTKNDESYILLNLHTDGGLVKVTYGGLTKSFSGSDTHTVTFGTYQGVADDVETPASGTLTIEGGCEAVACKSGVPCITGINNWGNMNRVEYAAFYGCKCDFRYIPEGITAIGAYGFQVCKAITDIRISATVKTIGSCAFKGCTNLTNVRMDAITPPAMATDVFTMTNDSFKIIVPAGRGEAYRTASGWSTYADRIVEAS